MNIKQETQPAHSQEAGKATNIVRLTVPKQDVLDHYNRCRAVHPIRKNAEVVEQ